MAMVTSAPVLISTVPVATEVPPHLPGDASTWTWAQNWQTVSVTIPVGSTLTGGGWAECGPNVVNALTEYVGLVVAASYPLAGGTGWAIRAWSTGTPTYVEVYALYF